MSDEPVGSNCAGDSSFRCGNGRTPDHGACALQMIFGWCGAHLDRRQTVGIKSGWSAGTLFPSHLHVARSSAAHRQPHLGRTLKVIVQPSKTQCPSQRGESLQRAVHKGAKPLSVAANVVAGGRKTTVFAAQSRGT